MPGDRKIGSAFAAANAATTSPINDVQRALLHIERGFSDGFA
jgi:hypothetical protein